MGGSSELAPIAVYPFYSNVYPFSELITFPKFSRCFNCSARVGVHSIRHFAVYRHTHASRLLLCRTRMNLSKIIIFDKFELRLYYNLNSNWESVFWTAVFVHVGVLDDCVFVHRRCFERRGFGRYRSLLHMFIWSNCRRKLCQTSSNLLT